VRTPQRPPLSSTAIRPSTRNDFDVAQDATPYDILQQSSDSEVQRPQLLCIVGDKSTYVFAGPTVLERNWLATTASGVSPSPGRRCWTQGAAGAGARLSRALHCRLGSLEKLSNRISNEFSTQSTRANRTRTCASHMGDLGQIPVKLLWPRVLRSMVRAIKTPALLNSSLSFMYDT
jgi:hypothetical protein